MDIILDILRQYGWFVGVFLGIAFLLGKFITSNYESWSKKPNKASDETILKHHPFFSNAEYRFLSEIPHLNLMLNKPVREKVFKDLLLISFKIIYKNVTSFVEDKELSEWTVEEWMDITTKLLNKIVIETEEKAKLEAIPEVIIKKFLKWHNESIQSLHEYTLLLGTSKLYDTNISKTNTLLLILNLLLVTVLGDAEKVFAELNGEITGMMYKGLIIE